MQQWNDQDTLPTTLYIWKEAELVRGNPRRKYREYMDCLDVLTQHQVTLSLVTYVCALVGYTLYHKLTQLQNVQVTWCPWDALELRDYLSPVTRQESDEYRCNVPLIFFHVVEIHLPIRICRQFGRIIGYPPPLYSTNQELHGCIIDS
jgi:hypothetical protein